jgi:RNA polymerase sigma-70 factor (ECF subfamily)
VEDDEASDGRPTDERLPKGRPVDERLTDERLADGLLDDEGLDDDERLMERVQSGPNAEAALELLFQRYQGRLFGFLIRRCGEAATAEDLIQETWIRALRARDRYDPRRRFSTWLFQIANNLCRDRGRRREVERRGHQSMQQIEAMEPTTTEATPHPRLRGERTEMESLLDALPDRLREVVVLRYHQQLSEQEISRVAEIPKGTVKSRLHAAVRALRAAMDPADGERDDG